MTRLRITAYVDLRCTTRQPTGVEKHIARMPWAASPWPPIDRFCSGADWIYSPQELWAPAKHARTTVTIHGATYFEPEYPGYHAAGAGSNVR